MTRKLTKREQSMTADSPPQSMRAEQGRGNNNSLGVTSPSNFAVVRKPSSMNESPLSRATSPGLQTQLMIQKGKLLR